jgi:hypothetical protein
LVKKTLKITPGHGQAPDDHHHHHAKRPAERDEQEGRVGAGDEQVDGAVVDDLEHALGAGVGDGVVERRGQEEEDDAQPVNHRADDVGAAVMLERAEEHEHQAKRAQHRAKAVGQAVEDLFDDVVVPGLLDSGARLLHIDHFLTSSNSGSGVMLWPDCRRMQASCQRRQRPRHAQSNFTAAPPFVCVGAVFNRTWRR